MLIVKKPFFGVTVTQPRKHIEPKAVVQVRTESERRAAIDAARQVIQKHHDVLVALRDR